MTKTKFYGGLILGIAVIMVFSSVAPVLQQAFAHDVTEPKAPFRDTKCLDGYDQKFVVRGTHPDHNFNRLVCVKDLPNGNTITLDDNAHLSLRCC